MKYVLYDNITDEFVSKWVEGSPKKTKWGGSYIARAGRNGGEDSVGDVHAFQTRVGVDYAKKQLTKEFENEPGGSNFEIFKVQEMKIYRFLN